MSDPQTTDLSQEHHCVWQQNDDGQYEACGENIFTIIEGTPSDNGMKFCCYCSYPIEEKPYEAPHD